MHSHLYHLRIWMENCNESQLYRFGFVCICVRNWCAAAHVHCWAATWHLLLTFIDIIWKNILHSRHAIQHTNTHNSIFCMFFVHRIIYLYYIRRASFHSFPPFHITFGIVSVSLSNTIIVHTVYFQRMYSTSTSTTHTHTLTRMHTFTYSVTYTEIYNQNHYRLEFEKNRRDARLPVMRHNHHSFYVLRARTLYSCTIFHHTIFHSVCMVVVGRWINRTNRKPESMPNEGKKKKKSKRNGQVSTDFPRFSAHWKTLYATLCVSPVSCNILISKLWLHRVSCDLMCTIEL